nr:MarR family transcriptional regulator [Leucobacter exalbidus]
MRDTLVLAVCGDGIDRTQIEIAETLGLDKTTLMSILDRLEKQEFLVRNTDPRNRRVRIPCTTPAGQSVLDEALSRRDERVSNTLSDFNEDEIGALRTQLWRIATAR